MQVDFGYSAHRRIVPAVSGIDSKGKPFVSTERTVILENRVNGALRSVTVLSDGTPTGRAVARLTGESARY